MRCSGPEAPSRLLSGGNIQKLILARVLDRSPRLVLANQPTRGVDVGAVEFLGDAILEQRADGTGVVLLSENLDEVFALSDRILVISEGEIVAQTTPEAADHETVGLWMGGETTGSEGRLLDESTDATARPDGGNAGSTGGDVR